MPIVEQLQADREKQLRILVTACGLGSPIKSAAHCLPPLKAPWLVLFLKSSTKVTTNRGDFQEVLPRKNRSFHEAHCTRHADVPSMSTARPALSASI